MISKKIIALGAVAACFSVAQGSFAATENLLCGNDEGGCNASNIYSCVCVMSVARTGVCLDLDAGKCVPKSATTHNCPVGTQDKTSVIKCETVLWQSTYTPGGNNCKPLNVAPAKNICFAKCTSIFNKDCSPTLR